MTLQTPFCIAPCSVLGVRGGGGVVAGGVVAGGLVVRGFVMDPQERVVSLSFEHFVFASIRKRLLFNDDHTPRVTTSYQGDSASTTKHPT